MSFHNELGFVAASAKPLQDVLLQEQQIFVKQKRELAEVFLNFEFRNKYLIMGSNGQAVGSLVEEGSGFLAFLKRTFFGSHRPLQISVFDTASNRVLMFSRKFFWFFSDLLVHAPSGQMLGSAHRRFGIIYKKYDLCDPSGQVFARIKSSIWRLWTFPISDPTEATQLGSISKKWGGILTEIFTDADTFCIDFGTHKWTAHQRSVIFASAISIDFDFFEDNQKRPR